MATNSYVQVPPDSTGKKLYAQQHLVDTNTVQVQVIHAADPEDPTHIQHVDERGAASVRFSEGSPLADGFGNLKVSQAVTIGNYSFVADSDEDLWSHKIVGNASITYLSAKSTMQLSTTTALGDEAEMMTHHHHYYLPGISNMLLMTVALSDAGTTGCVRRWGMFSEENGVFFKLNSDNQLYVDIRSNITGSIVHTKIPQSQWNGDKLDGTGISKFVLDVTKLNLYFIDFQWLGGGRVRFGIIDEYGNRVVCHTMLNANSNLYPYTLDGCFPVAINIENKAELGSSPSIRLTCATVKSEGYLDYTYWRFSHNFPVKTVNNNTYLIALKSKTLLANGRHNVITGYPESIGLYITGGPIKLDIYWDFYQDVNGAALITGANWIDNDSSIVADTSGTLDVTTGWSPKTWYIDAGVHNIDLTSIFEKNDFGIDANSDTNEPVYIVLAATALTGTPTNVLGSLNYAELR